MSYQVLARKWRPQQFDEVIGQGHVTQTLINAIASQRVAHAYLFVGPRGTGKTSLARIFAKALNCRQGPTERPCDQCDSCREIMAGNSLDVLEIDAASNTGVEHVRDLRQNTQYTPTRGPYKIYIIDEVHMLSTAAFNALLKTLEEPPAHVKFFFATTEVQKLPTTILSRCQRFDLRRIALPDITRRLAEIAKAEGIAVDDDALLAIARSAEGGLRDAESALDQLIAFCGKRISEADVLAVFGLVSRAALEHLAAALLRGDMAAMVQSVAEWDAQGKDLQRLLLELILHLRNLLVLVCAPSAAAGLELPEPQLAALQAQAGLVRPSQLLRLIDVLAEAEGRMRFALSRRILLEVALVRCAHIAAVVPIEQVLEELETLKGMLPAGVSHAAREVPPAPPAAPRAAPPVPTLPLPPTASQPAGIPTPRPPASGDETDTLNGRWREIVERVGASGSVVKNYLLDAKPVRVTETQVTIGLDPEFARNMDLLKIPRNVQVVQRVLGEALGREVTVEFQVLDAKSTLPGDIKVEPRTAHKPAAHAPPPPAAPAPAGRKTMRDYLHDAAVQKTIEAFDGDITDIRE